MTLLDLLAYDSFKKILEELDHYLLWACSVTTQNHTWCEGGHQVGLYVFTILLNLHNQGHAQVRLLSFTNLSGVRYGITMIGGNPSPVLGSFSWELS
jgi:hypothetical protein